LPADGKQNVSNYTHIHNQFLMDMMLAGFFGLVTLLFFVLYPLWIYMKAYRQSNDSAVRLFALSGIVFVGYAIFTSLFGCVFTYTYSSIFYMIINGLLLGYLSQQGFSKESKV
jgi:O-antigen ligase